MCAVICGKSQVALGASLAEIDKKRYNRLMRVTKTAAKRFVQAVGANAKAARERLGITQQEVADRLDAWVPQVSTFEAGKRNLRLSDLYRHAIALETTPARLVDVEIHNGKGN